MLQAIKECQQDNFQIQRQKIQTKNQQLESLIIYKKKKTGLLIAFCCYAGGYIGNANKKELESLYEFGLILGRIFQITDDILDKEGTQKLLGKKVNKDEEQNKATLIKIKGIDFAKRELEKFSLQAKRKLLLLNKNTEVLSELIDFLCSRTS